MIISFSITIFDKSFNSSILNIFPRGFIGLLSIMSLLFLVIYGFNILYENSHLGDSSGIHIALPPAFSTIGL